MQGRSHGRWHRLAALLLAALSLGCTSHDSRAPAQNVIVLGFDGMDYALTKQLLEAGRLPNLARLAQSGQFAPLETTVPPQSPVAWSSFITGLDAGGHGIFDFIHRDPATMVPYLSTTRTEDGESVRLGSGVCRCAAAMSCCCDTAPRSGKPSRSTASRRRSCARLRTSHRAVRQGTS
jgi:hypothetical protein